jgi:hypothetical protein
LVRRLLAEMAQEEIEPVYRVVADQARTARPAAGLAGPGGQAAPND